MNVERVEEPSMPILDAHHHLWENSHHCRFGTYMQPEYASEIEQGHNVVASIYMECGTRYFAEGPETLRSVGETLFANEIATSDAAGRTDDRIAAGIVSYANLLQGSEVAAVLEKHLQAAPGRFRGIRHCCAWDSCERLQIQGIPIIPRMLVDSKFQAGLSQVQHYNLAFDVWLYHPQLTELDDAAQRLPGLTFVLDHMGGPVGIGPYAADRDAVVSQWKRTIALLARNPNIFVKLGGINMVLNGFRWDVRDSPPGSDELAASTWPYYEHVIDCFSPYRCMFESNFPMDKESCSYNVLWNAFKKMTRGYSADERRAMFYGTAAKVYRLPCPV